MLLFSLNFPLIFLHKTQHPSFVWIVIVFIFPPLHIDSNSLFFLYFLDDIMIFKTIFHLYFVLFFPVLNTLSFVKWLYPNYNLCSIFTIFILFAFYLPIIHRILMEVFIWILLYKFSFCCRQPFIVIFFKKFIIFLIDFDYHLPLFAFE